jgi:hypothetical protein
VGLAKSTALFVGVLLSLPLTGCVRIGYPVRAEETPLPRADGSPPSSGDGSVTPAPDGPPFSGCDVGCGDEGLPDPIPDGSPDAGVVPVHDASPVDAAPVEDGAADTGVPVRDAALVDAAPVEDGAADAVVDPCGNGVLDEGEECEGDSPWCVDCQFQGVDDWVLCDNDAAGTYYFFQVLAPRYRSWNDAQGECRSLFQTVEEVGLPMEPPPVYGLAVFRDGDAWNCLFRSGEIGPEEYWVGLTQRQSETNHRLGWRWKAFYADSDPWIHQVNVDTDLGSDVFPLAEDIDGSATGAASGAVDCARVRDQSGWQVADDVCDTDRFRGAICMIAYGLS